jgi:hypothetical protein
MDRLRVDPDARRSWYATALTAAAVAVLALLPAGHRRAFAVAALALAATAAVATIEGTRRGRGRPPSPLAVWLVGGLTVVAALLCLLGVTGLWS